MLKLAIILFCAGLYLIGSGCYDLFLQASTSREPTTVSVADLEKNLPANRHLVVTGGRPVSASAVKVYKTHWGTKVSGSEILFIPIADASAAASDHATPPILVRVTEDQINEAKAGHKINFRAIEGVRTTSMDLEGKARQRLVDTFGRDAVDRMVILEYHGRIGMVTGLGKVAGGVAMAGAVVAGFVFSRRSGKTTVAGAGTAPPVIPGQASIPGQT